MAVIAFYRQDRDRHKGPRRLSGVLLRPGANRISRADSDKLQAHPRWEYYQAAGILEICSESQRYPSAEAEIEPEIDPTDILNLLGFTVAQALPIVEAENDVERLRRWSAADTRGSLLRAIAARIRQLTPAESSGGSD